MDIKISGGAPTDNLETVQESSSISESTQEVDAIEAGSSSTLDGTDPVGQISEDLAVGRINGDEAVDRLIAATANSPMLSDAPEALRQELKEVLEDFISTDPYLSSLAHGLGAKVE